MHGNEWSDDEFNDGGLGDDGSPTEQVLEVLAASDGATARSIAASLRMPADEVTEMLEDLHTNGEVEKDGDDLWVVPDMAGPDDPYIF
jgi:predicted ArsR family transcriptional regulator